MKKDKAFLKIDGLTAIEFILYKLKDICTEIIVVTNYPQRYRRFMNKPFSAKVVRDLIPHAGPLGGIYTGLSRADNFFSCVIACDMPLVNKGLINFMRSNARNYAAVVPRPKGLNEPLFAIYSKDCLEPIKRCLQKSRLKASGFLKDIKVKYIADYDITKFDPFGLSFFNMNTLNDYQRLT